MNELITTGILIYGKQGDETTKIIQLCKRLHLKYQFKDTKRNDVLVIGNKKKMLGYPKFLKFIQNKYKIL